MSNISPSKSVLIKLLSVILFIPFYILLVSLWLLIILPFKIYRRFVTYMAYLKDPEIGPPISKMQAAQIRDFSTIHEKPGTTQVVCLRFKGPMNYDLIIEKFIHRVLLRLDSSKVLPTFEYIELQKYFVNIMGYVFRKQDMRFNIYNHISLYNPNALEPVSRTELKKIWENLMIKPFPKGRSLWEILIIDNYSPDRDELEEWNRIALSDLNCSPCNPDNHYWAVLVRLHHGLGDGFSIQKILSHMSDTNFTPDLPIKITPFQRFLWNVRTLTLGPFDAIERALRQAEPYHSLHKPYSKHAKECYVMESPLISTKLITDLKIKFKVPFTTILVALISGGLRKYFIKYQKPIPRSMSTALPVAIKDHSGKLGNEYSLAIIPYAIHLPDPGERVDFINRELKSLVSSSWIKMFDLFIDSYASLPTKLLQWITEKSLLYSSTYSTMPGPKEPVRFFDATLMEVTYSYGTSPDSSGFGISSLTYNGFFRFVLFIDKNVVQSREEAGEMVNFIYEELDVLDDYFVETNSKNNTLEEKMEASLSEDGIKMLAS